MACVHEADGASVGVVVRVEFHRRACDAGAISGARHDEIQACGQAHSVSDVVRSRGDHVREVDERLAGFALFIEGQFAPSVAHVHCGEWFDEEGCVGVGYVVDDAWYLVAELGSYLQDEAVCAHGYYAVLQGGCSVG